MEISFYLTLCLLFFTCMHTRTGWRSIFTKKSRIRLLCVPDEEVDFFLLASSSPYYACRVIRRCTETSYDGKKNDLIASDDNRSKMFTFHCPYPCFLIPLLARRLPPEKPFRADVMSLRRIDSFPTRMSVDVALKICGILIMRRR